MLCCVVLSGRGSEPLGRIWSSWDQNGELRPLVINGVVKLRRGPRLAGVGARRSSRTPSPGQLEAARWVQASKVAW